MEDIVQYMSEDKITALKLEMKDLKDNKITGLAKRIDEARQMGDLSENAEYHAAREEMAWAQSRVKEIEAILGNAEVISHQVHVKGIIGIGSKIKVKLKGMTKEYTIVGAQEANPGAGLISNESPLGQAFLGCRKGDAVDVKVPAGTLVYEIVSVE